MNVVEEYQVKALHIICLCTTKRGRGAGAMSLIVQRKRTSSLSRDTEIKYSFKWKVFIVRQRHIEASFMNTLKYFVLKAQKSPHHTTKF